MKSKITERETRFLFNGEVLNKYNIRYYQCVETGFIQTEPAYWLEEAYSSAITPLDIGLLLRNEKLADATELILQRNFNPDASFLDYAGGYGTFTRIMRNRGYDFHHDDPFCENLFAKTFSLDDAGADRFELITAFEVFEHFDDPVEDIKKIFNYGGSVLFSTELIPQGVILESTESWPYFVPDIGQHIALYSIKSLQFLAQQMDLHFVSNGFNLHLFSKNPISEDLFSGLSQIYSGQIIRKQLCLHEKRTKIDWIKTAKTLFSPKNIVEAIKYISLPQIAPRESLLEKDTQSIKFRS